MGANISLVRDFVAIVALAVAIISAGVAILTLRRNSRVQKAQFVANLTRDFFQDSDLRRFFYRIDYERFRFDSKEVAEFKGSEDERHLDALLYQYNMVGRLVRVGVISPEDVEFLLFEIVQVFKNADVKRYIAWLDTEFEKFGDYGSSQRRRPVDDVRWFLEKIGSDES